MRRNIRQVIMGLCVVFVPFLAAHDASASRLDVKRYQLGGDIPIPAAEMRAVLEPSPGLQKDLFAIEEAGSAASVTADLFAENTAHGYERNVGAVPEPAMPGAESVPVFRFTIRRFDIGGENPLSPEEAREVLAPFIGEHEGISALHEAAETLQAYLIDNGFSFYRVILPPQTLREGVVRLDIIAFKVDKIEISGNEHFSDENILRSIPALKVGEVPNTSSIAQDRLHANDHPSKRIDVRFRESEVVQSLNANIRAQDSRPLNVFFSLNNTGTSETGRLRSTLGFQYSNLFDLDHVVRLSYTTSPEDLSAVQQYGAFYSAPIYSLNGDFSAFYVNSNVDSGLVGGAFDVSGAGEFVGLTYNQRLPRFGSYTHSVGVSFEDKLFENDIVFQGVQIGNDVRSRPVQAIYQGSRGSKAGNLNFYLSYSHNIQSGSKNDDLSYTLARLGADPDWGAFRFGTTGDAALPAGWSFSGRMDGQYAGEPLIPGEQFGIGGAFSVRGYEEREETGDSGVFVSTEIWAPTLPFDVRLLGFVDYGYVNKDEPLPGERRDVDLLGAGFGLRWAWRANVSLGVNLAHAFSSAILTEAGDNTIHFNLLLRY